MVRSSMKQVGGDADSSIKKSEVAVKATGPSADPFEVARDSSKKNFEITEVKEIAEDEGSQKGALKN